MTQISQKKPMVELLAYTSKPFDTAVASARTCYSSELIYANSVTDGQRERIGKSIFNAGHHTPFQHPTFIFGLKNVSRQCVWSFLHSHPFFNSEQQSQRYVVMDEASVYMPNLCDGDQKIYTEAVSKAWEAYDRISGLLKDDNFKLMSGIGRIKGLDEKNVRIESEKKAIEMARYVLPVAATCNLYHTVSGITLHRYKMMALKCDTPHEAKYLVDQMISEVRKIDPNFFDMISEESSPTCWDFERDLSFIKKFDRKLEGRASKLISYDKNAEKIVADSVREVLGVRLTDDEAIELIMNPSKNKDLISTVNTYVHSPIMRALNHVNYTFKVKISHTADSQDQRHRMTPGSRPLLSRVHTEKPDYHLPIIVEQNDEARKIYLETMEMLWNAKNKLISNGVSNEDACYLLPNAVNVRFTQSGSLLNWMHKWRLRTCFNAQLEIYDASMEQLREVAAVHPRLAKYLGPPCFVRKHGGMKNMSCPEGPRWCGIRVWLNFPNVQRPF